MEQEFAAFKSTTEDGELLTHQIEQSRGRDTALAAKQ
jgi:hypothetical protein